MSREKKMLLNLIFHHNFLAKQTFNLLSSYDMKNTKLYPVDETNIGEMTKQAN